VLPLLIPIITQLAPSLIDWLFGSKAAATTTAVVDAVKAATGADPTTAEGVAVVTAMIEGKPDVALDLQSKLLTIRAQMQAEADREADTARQADVDAMKASIADIANARQQTVDLAKTGSVIAYGAPFISLVVIVSFGVMSWLVMFRTIPPGSETLAAGVLEALKLLSVTVVSFWCGSSVSSRAKDDTIANAQVALANSTPVK
jgi:hypothetical protein